LKSARQDVAMSATPPNSNEPDAEAAAPLRGLKVLEFTHMVMGPSVGVILGDLGAEVIKVEPIDGDATRRLLGSGAGYFTMYNRNKRSIRIDLKHPEGLAVARDLAQWADVLIENFRPGALDRLGLGYEALKAANPGLIYCSAKGFLPGPYDTRTALDEVAQMMGGLAYMTGPSGRPLRAGASVIDVTGGMFGVIGILAALHEKQRTGLGQMVDCSLFETTAFLVGQHIAQKAVTGVAARPMPERVSAWAVYDVFDTADGEQVFVGVVSDAQWRTFCRVFELAELGADESLAANNQRVKARDRLLPQLRALFATMSKAELLRLCEEANLPFAPITRPEDLVSDPHLLASEGLVNVSAGEGRRADIPTLPLRLNAKRPGLRRDVPESGEHSREILGQALGLNAARINALEVMGVVGFAASETAPVDPK
jgi:crotonobetainyl-CoA:carnitine CoA-transferase CaiB-like acyl-CoA transferase